MQLSLTEEQAMIREAAQSYLADASDSAAVRSAMKSEAGYDPAVWQTIATELGWCGVAIDESHGGLGLGVTELVHIQEQAGYRLLCSPFFSTVCLAANLLQSIGSDEAQAEYLPRIAAGELIATAPLSSAADAWQSTLVTANKQGDRWQLSGKLSRVPNAAAAEAAFVFAEADDGPGLFAVATGAKGLQITSLDTWDATRRFSSMEMQNVNAIRCDDANGLATGREQAAAITRLLIAAEQLGAAQRCLDLTVEYTAERKQFGRVVAGFQAVKHRCAQMMIQVEALRSAVYGAAAVAAEQPDIETLSMECAMTKALASDALFFCAGEAIQLHGGVGFTWEYDPQLYFKRARASKSWMGTPEALRARIAEVLI